MINKKKWSSLFFYITRIRKKLTKCKYAAFWRPPCSVWHSAAEQLKKSQVCGRGDPKAESPLTPYSIERREPWDHDVVVSFNAVALGTTNLLDNSFSFLP
jgi:hypothetical protein